MAEQNSGIEFLQKKYQLNTDPGVDSAVRHRESSKATIAQSDYSKRIQVYLDRLHNIINPSAAEENLEPGRTSGEQRRQRKLDMLKKRLYKQFVIKPEEIPEAYFDSIKRRHREEGHGDIKISDDYRNELIEAVVSDQKKSLDNWIDYLTSSDAKYPDWQKYFVFRSILHMGRYDKQKGSFTERTGGAVSPFPDLNREALAIVLGDLEKKYPSSTAPSNGEQYDFQFTSRSDISGDVRKRYLQALENKSFAKLYALAIEEFKPIAAELLKVTQGEWRKYPRGSDHLPLVASVADYGTGWCLRGEAMARRYLLYEQNTLEVYYSNNKEGKPVIPRVVMVTNAEGNLVEVRGIEKGENLDPYIGDVVKAKLAEHPDGKKFEKKSADMKFLTRIDNKTKTGEELTAEELTFLYEIDSSIEGFGYEKNGDPRIKELRSQRNIENDMLIIFGCEPSQIAHSASEIGADTKAYVGPLFPGIFGIIQRIGIEHVYTKFPERKIKQGKAEINNTPASHLEEELELAGINISDYAKEMLHSKGSTVSSNPRIVETVRLRVEDLGFERGATTAKIYQRIDELGLELCPSEIAPYYRLQYTTQPLDSKVYVGMKQIPNSRGRLHIFELACDDEGLYLNDAWADPHTGWPSDYEFVFSLPKPAA